MKKFNPKLSKILNEFNTQIEIPEYQRTYTWTKENISPFFDDIFTAFSTDDLGKFQNDDVAKYKEQLENYVAKTDEFFYIGQIVKEENKIVDGQQRLTSIMIIFKAIFDYINIEFKQELDERPIFQAIDSTRIISAIVDQPASKLMQETIEPISLIVKKNYIPKNCVEPKDIEEFRLKIADFKTTNFYKNYLIISTQLKRLKLSQNQAINLKNFILRFIHVSVISLENTEDAVTFFEIMNSKSLPLTPADLIKNRMIKNSPNKEETARSWNKVEQDLSDDSTNLSKFIRFVHISLHGQVSAKKLFSEASKNDVIKELEKYLPSYKKLAGLVDIGSEIIDAQLNFILTIGASESLSPIILEIFNTCKSDEKVSELLGQLVSFSFKFFYRNGFKSNLYANKVTDICKSIRSGQANPLKILFDIYNEELGATENSETISEYKIEWFKFTNDYGNDAIRFAKAVYPLILANLPKINYDSDEIKKYRLNLENLDIEHIFPKTDKIDNWEKLINEDLKWHIGNLIPISSKKNRTIKNSSFAAKYLYYMGVCDANGLEISDGKISYIFEKLFVDLLPEVNEKTKWNDENINKRTNKIFELSKLHDIFKIKGN